MSKVFEGFTLRELEDHIKLLAKEYDIQIHWITSLLDGPHSNVNFDQKTKKPLLKEIFVPRIRGPISYYLALHEIGHVADPQGGQEAAFRFSDFFESSGMKLPWDWDLKLLNEYFAINWAMKYALIWTSSMKKALYYGVRSHERHSQSDARGYQQNKKQVDDVVSFLKFAKLLGRPVKVVGKVA